MQRQATVVDDEELVLDGGTTTPPGAELGPGADAGTDDGGASGDGPADASTTVAAQPEGAAIPVGADGPGAAVIGDAGTESPPDGTDGAVPTGADGAVTGADGAVPTGADGGVATGGDVSPDAELDAGGGRGPDGGQPDAAGTGGPDTGGDQDGRTGDETVAPETEAEEAAACEPNPEYEALVERWGEPGSERRRRAIQEAHDSAGRLDAFGEGFLGAGGIGLASALLEYGGVYLVARQGVSQAARVAGPIGAVVGGIVGAYALWNRGPEGIGAALAFSGWGEGTSPDEVLANNWNAVAEFLDVLGATADVVGGLAGVVALAGTVIGLIPGLQAALAVVPIATQIAFWGGIVGLACGVMKGIAQYVSRTYRESHLLNMRIMNEEEMVYQQRQLSSQVQANYQFLGGMAGAGTVAVGRHLARPRPVAGADGGQSVRVPHEQQVITARQRATPERLEQLRQVDEALTGHRPGRTAAGTTERAATDAARHAVPEAGRRLNDATQARARAEAQARASGEADAAATRDAADADARAREARADADRAAQALEESRQRRAQSEDAAAAIAEQRRVTADAGAEHAAQLDALREAQDARAAQASEVSRLEAEARQHRATEAQALEQYRSMERGQMALALAEHAAAQARQAEAQLGPARQRLGELDQAVAQRSAAADAAQARYDAARAGLDALDERARSLPEPPDDAAHQSAVSRASDAQQRARELQEQADAQRAGSAEARQRAEEATAQARRAAADEDGARERVSEAHGRLEDAHGREVEAAREPTTPRAEAREAAQATAEGGGTAQDVLGDPYQSPEAREVRIVEPCLAGTPPSSTAAIEADTAEAIERDTIAAEAETRQHEAEADAEARLQDAANLLQLDQAVQDRRGEAESTDRGLDQRRADQEQLETTRQETNTRVDEAGDDTGDLVTFARFVGRMLGYASWFDHDLMPDAVRSAGRGIAETGERIQEATSGTVSGIAEQRSSRGAVESADATRKAETEQSKAELAGTASTIDQTATEVGEMRVGNEQLQAIASEHAARTGQIRDRAVEEAAQLRARRDQNRAALDAWAEESRATRHQWVDETTADLEAQGYEVTGVGGR